MSYYYLKLHHDMLYDPKMGMLSDHLYRRVIEIFLMASEMPERDGYLPSLDIMAWKLHVNKDELKFELMELEKETGIVIAYPGGVWFVRNFAKRQASTDPTAAERMQRHRERNANVTDKEDVTRNVTRNEDEKLRVELRVKNLDIKQEEEINKDKEDSRLTPRRQHQYSDIVKLFMDTWRVKRINDNQEAAINELSKYPIKTISEFVKWASIKQMRFGDAINSAPASLAKWGEPKTQPRNGKEPKEEPKTGKDYLAGSLKDYIKS